MAITPYATSTDYIQIFGQREAIEQSNLDSPTAESVQTAVIDEALLNASSEMNGLLAMRYAVPILPPPPMLVLFACRLARKELDRYQRREHVQKDYDETIKRLKWIAEGKELLLDDNGNPVPVDDDNAAISYGRVSFGAQPQRFTLENMSSYQRGWDYH